LRHNPTALENYIVKLQGVATTLTDKNRRLRKSHRALAEKVTALFAMDLAGGGFTTGTRPTLELLLLLLLHLLLLLLLLILLLFDISPQVK